MVRNWQRWMGLFLVLGVVVIMTTGGCLEFGAKNDDEPATTTGGSGTSYSYFISGKITANGTNLSGVTMSLSGSKTDSTSTDQNGNYTFLVNNGNYIITPSLTGYSFSPGSTALSINSSSWSGVNFTASASAGGTTYTISGTVSDVGSGATVMLTGPSAATTMTDANGNYSFSGLANGSYTVSASKPGNTINPTNQNVMVNGANQTNINFTGAVYSGTTYTIGGRVATSTTAGVGDVLLVLNGPVYQTIFANSDGYYTFSNIQAGSYTITANKDGYYFEPSNISVYITGNVNNQNFTATQALADTFTIHGVLHGDGSLVNNQVVNLNSGSFSRSTMTDYSGYYSFPGLPNGTYYIDPVVNTVPDNRNVTINGADSYGNDFDVAASFSISGNITYLGSKVGQMFINVAWDGGGETQWGTCIDWMSPSLTPRNYTIRGVKPGAYKISARLDFIGDFDATRNANDPTGVSGTVNVTGANVTNANLTVTDPTGPATATAISSIVAIPGDQSVLLFWDTPENDNEEETASRYNIYWGTNPAIDPANSNTFSGTATAFAQEDGHFFTTGLTNGTVYYFVTTSQTGGIVSAPSAAISATVGATIGSYTVSGQVTMPIADTNIENKWLMVGLYSDNQGGAPTLFMNAYLIPSPCPVQMSYSIAGIPDGTYTLFQLIDMDGNGVINSGDYKDTETGVTVVVNGANATRNITIPTANVIANASTGHHRDLDYGDSYHVSLWINEGKCTPVRVTLLYGPNVFEPEDIGKNWSFDTWIDMRSARPNLGDTYTFEAGFANGTTETVTVEITGVLDIFAGSLAVLDTPTVVTPTFSWAAPANPPDVYIYSFRVEEEITMDGGWVMSNYIWETEDGIPSAQTSVIYNFDGEASLPALEVGHTYRWTVVVVDANRNSSSVTTRFTR